ncbi:MAG: hypothetical protein HY718_02295 [Planctomycetes bacterium]|nr:hypothetical protein [Planctomycetota bacterium]
MLRRLTATSLAVWAMWAVAGSVYAADLIPAPPFKLKDIDASVAAELKINTFTAAKTTHTWDITCPGETKKLGMMKFEYAPYTGDFDGGNLNNFGGAIIRGGFTKTDEACETAPGWSYRWLQHLVISGDQTRDTIDGDPLYPDYTLAGFDALLFDAPGRGPLGTSFTNLTWRAESALVCVKDKAIKVIGAFTWGFNIVTNEGNTTVTGFSPQGWSNTIPAGLSTRFTAEYGPSGTVDTGWTLESGCCCIPEPSTLLLLAACPLLALRRRAA